MSCVTTVTSPATRERSRWRANALSLLQSGAQSIAVISPTMTAVPVIPQAFTYARHAHGRFRSGADDLGPDDDQAHDLR